MPVICEYVFSLWLFFQPSDAESEESDDDSDYSEYSEGSESEGKMWLVSFVTFILFVFEKEWLNVQLLCSQTHFLSDFLKQETIVTELCRIFKFVTCDYAHLSMM
jgi:hypothetical protein